MKHMAAHFHGKHNRSWFNDNGDGTFSKVGTYLNEEGSSPGIIVSRNPLSPGAPPPATPDYSESQKKWLAKKSPPTAKVPNGGVGSTPLDTSKRSLRADANNDGMDGRLPKRPKTTPVPLPTQAIVPPPPPPPPAPLSLPPMPPSLPPALPAPPPSLPPLPNHSLEPPPMTETLKYLHRFLSEDQQIPSRPDVLALSKYERVRNMPAAWIDYHMDKAIDPFHYACVVAYLVGVAEEKNPCRKWKGVSRLSDPCVALPLDLPAAARAAFSKTETCIACQYQSCYYNVQNECEWAARGDGPQLSGKIGETTSEQKHKSAFENGHKIVVLDDDTDDDAHTGHSRLATMPPVTRQRSTMSEPDKPTTEGSSKNGVPPATAARKLSPAETGEMEEMEDWEVAPGTIKDAKSNTSEYCSPLAHLYITNTLTNHARHWLFQCVHV